MTSISSSRLECLTVQKQCGSTRDVVQELRIRNRAWTCGKRQKNLAVAVQLKWKLMGQFCSIRRCFSMWFHTEKIRRQVCLEPDLYVATCCHAFRSSCDVALASPNVQHLARWPPFFLFHLCNICLKEHLYKIWEKSIWYFYHVRATFSPARVLVPGKWQRR